MNTETIAIITTALFVYFIIIWLHGLIRIKQQKACDHSWLHKRMCANCGKEQKEAKNARTKF